MLRLFIGVWLSLVERCVRDAEVACSNPVTPTIKIKHGRAVLYFMHWSEVEQRVPQVPKGTQGLRLRGSLKRR